MLVSGLSVFFIYLLNTRAQSVAMSCVFSAISVIGWSALDVLQAELFPTNLRSALFQFLTCMLISCND